MDTKMITDKKQVMIMNKQSESEIIHWQQLIKHYHETKLVHNNQCKISHTKPSKIKQYKPYNLLELFLKENVMNMRSPPKSNLFFSMN